MRAEIKRSFLRAFRFSIHPLMFHIDFITNTPFFPFSSVININPPLYRMWSTLTPYYKRVVWHNCGGNCGDINDRRQPQEPLCPALKIIWNSQPIRHTCFHSCNQRRQWPILMPNSFHRPHAYWQWGSVNDRKSNFSSYTLAQLSYVCVFGHKSSSWVSPITSLFDSTHTLPFLLSTYYHDRTTVCLAVVSSVCHVGTYVSIIQLSSRSSRANRSSMARSHMT